jgi:beta-galactosidase/beta-glucuronidase
MPPPSLLPLLAQPPQVDKERSVREAFETTSVLPVLPTQLPTEMRAAKSLRPATGERYTSCQGKVIINTIILLSVVAISARVCAESRVHQHITMLQQEVTKKDERVATLLQSLTRCKLGNVASGMYDLKNQRITMLQHLVVEKEQRLVKNYGVAFEHLKASELERIDVKVDRKNRHIARLEWVVQDREEQQHILAARIKVCPNTLNILDATLASKDERIAALERKVEAETSLSLSQYMYNEELSESNGVESGVNNSSLASEH